MREWLNKLDQHLPVRYATWLFCVVAMLLSLLAFIAMGQGLLLVLLFGALTVVGWHDTLQSKRSVLRNYPVIGHVRFLLEFIRPEIRQYFIEPDNEAAPFSRAAALAGLPARQGRARQAALRHAARRACERLRVDQPLDRADRRGQPRLSRDHRRRSCPALRGQHLQHLGDELRLAVGQRHPGAERAAPDAAASRTTPAKARSASTTASTAAT